jgi:phosphoribosylformimino-5-aminoimidazole carboxamide ribonucleotide (ProFAR) isomerase
MISLDSKDNKVVIKGWQEKIDKSATEISKEFQDLGAGSILFTNVDVEGLLGGFYTDPVVDLVNSVDIPVISSGGIRSGLDAAKAIALGADAVGMALPALKGAYEGQEALVQMVERFNESLRIAMFLVGASNIEELKNSSLVIKGETKDWLEARGFDTKAYARR